MPGEIPVTGVEGVGRMKHRPVCKIAGGWVILRTRGSSASEHRVHGPEVAGSSPAPASTIMRLLALTWLISASRPMPCVFDVRTNEGPQKGRVPG